MKFKIIIETPEEIKERKKLHKKGRLMHNEYNRKCMNKIKEKNPNYLNELAEKSGFKNNSERSKVYSWKSGKSSPYWLNENCPPWLGIHIAERLLPSIFDNPIRMPVNNPGYDFICKNGYKIDVKSSCLRYQYGIRSDNWWFPIRKNKIADYFLCIAFDNRKDLNPKHVWIIKSNDKVFNRNVNDRNGLVISDCERSLSIYSKYELIDKLDVINKVCVKYKINSAENSEM